MLRNASLARLAGRWLRLSSRRVRHGGNWAVAASIGLCPFAIPNLVAAQSTGFTIRGAASDAGLDTLLARALARHPDIRAGLSRVSAARARVSPAGAWPDPTLTAGVLNLPISRESGTLATPPMATGADPMTMRMVGIAQTIPYPGKLSLQRRVAGREVEAAEASLDATRRRIAREVKDAYYEIEFLDRAGEILERNQTVLAGLIRATEARYGAGLAGQQDVLKSRVEAARLAETAVSVAEQRRAMLARLNGLLDQPSETPLGPTALPSRLVRAAVADSASEIRFASSALGARAADSPLPPLVELQETAVRDSPQLREQAAMIAVQAARVDLARREVRPDVDVSLQYGQRTGYPDMVSAMLSVPIPIQRRGKQDQLAAAAGSELATLEAEGRSRQNEIRADVARLVSDIERNRAQLALYVKAVLPQSRASLASALGSYQAGKVEFLTVLDDQATIFTYETGYVRALTDFAKSLAELEQIVGAEVLR